MTTKTTNESTPYQLRQRSAARRLRHNALSTATDRASNATHLTSDGDGAERFSRPHAAFGELVVVERRNDVDVVAANVAVAKQRNLRDNDDIVFGTY